MDEVFRALADPSLRRLLDRLNDRTGQTLHELCAGQGLTRQSVSKHLAIREAANRHPHCGASSLVCYARFNLPGNRT
jgi:DNA-binding transcriptional ArsR family regulator